MNSVYILEGPAGCGNVFGIYNPDLLPPGRFAVVRNGEYANGGHGPSTVDGKSYRSREEAEKAMVQLAEAK